MKIHNSSLAIQNRQKQVCFQTNKHFNLVFHSDWKMDIVRGLREIAKIADGVLPEEFLKETYTSIGNFNGESHAPS